MPRASLIENALTSPRQPSCPGGDLVVRCSGFDGAVGTTQRSRRSKWIRDPAPSDRISHRRAGRADRLIVLLRHHRHVDASSRSALLLGRERMRRGRMASHPSSASGRRHRDRYRHRLRERHTAAIAPDPDRGCSNGSEQARSLTAALLRPVPPFCGELFVTAREAGWRREQRCRLARASTRQVVTHSVGAS